MDVDTFDDLTANALLVERYTPVPIPCDGLANPNLDACPNGVSILKAHSSASHIHPTDLLNSTPACIVEEQWGCNGSGWMIVFPQTNLTSPK